MIQRLAITAAGITAAVVLTVGLVAAGFVPGSSRPPEDAALAADAAPGVDSADVQGSEPEVVYVKPAPKPRTIVVEKQAGRTSVAARQSGATPRTVRAQGEDREDREDREDSEDREDREEHDD